MNDKEIYILMTKNQEEFFIRLDKMNKRYTRANIITTICISIIILLWTYSYFHTPYLTKNYNNVNNSGHIEEFKGGD